VEGQTVDGLDGEVGYDLWCRLVGVARWEERWVDQLRRGPIWQDSRGALCRRDPLLRLIRSFTARNLRIATRRYSCSHDETSTRKSVDRKKLASTGKDWRPKRSPRENAVGQEAAMCRATPGNIPLPTGHRKPGRIYEAARLASATRVRIPSPSASMVHGTFSPKHTRCSRCADQNLVNKFSVIVNE
jgi:hypothetical protein